MSCVTAGSVRAPKSIRTLALAHEAKTWLKPNDEGGLAGIATIQRGAQLACGNPPRDLNEVGPDDTVAAVLGEQPVGMGRGFP